MTSTFRNEKMYQTTMHLARKMLSDGIISERDYDYIVNEEKAVFIRKIYEDFLADVPMGRTARWLKENGCPYTTKQFVKSVLMNVAYTGDLLLQRHFSPRVRHMKKNNGEVPMYHVRGHHPAIFKLFLDGMSTYSIAEELTRRGIKSPGGKDKWHR